MDTPLINVTEVCRRLGVSRQIFYRLRKAGSIPPPLAGSKKYSWPQVAAAIGLPSDADFRRAFTIVDRVGQKFAKKGKRS